MMMGMNKRIAGNSTGGVIGRSLRAAALLLLMMCIAAAGAADARADEAADDAAKDVIRVGKLVYAGGQTPTCFADAFLSDFTRQTEIEVHPQLMSVELSSDEAFNYPMVIFSGQAKFTLGERERDNLLAYMQGGGFIIASAGCSNPEWQDSFTSLVKEMLPDAKLEDLPMEHEIFSTVYEIRSLKNKRRFNNQPLQGLFANGRLVMVYGPEGLNDTKNAGGDCCCCGGNEWLNARLINVNLLAYALTH